MRKQRSATVKCCLRDIYRRLSVFEGQMFVYFLVLCHLEMSRSDIVQTFFCWYFAVCFCFFALAAFFFNQIMPSLHVKFCKNDLNLWFLSANPPYPPIFVLLFAVLPC